MEEAFESPPPSNDDPYLAHNNREFRFLRAEQGGLRVMTASFHDRQTKHLLAFSLRLFSNLGRNIKEAQLDDG
jgi:hypothetical protein